VKHGLTFAVAALAAGAVSASAAISAVTLVDRDYGLGLLDPAYQVVGWWTPLTPGDLTIKDDTYWYSVFEGTRWNVGGVDIWLMSVEANHDGVPPLVPTFAAVLGMANVAGNNGTVYSYVSHAGSIGDGDYYKFYAEINPSGVMNFDLKGFHTASPEPGALAMVAGLGLVGFAAWRRVRT